MVISVTEFKAKCLAILERIRATGERVTVTKRGVPVAEVIPPSHAKTHDPQKELKGTVRVLGDLLEPVMPPGAWEAESAPRRRKRRR